MESQLCSVFDLGSQTIKVQLSTASKPISVLSLAGKPKYKKVIFSGLSDYDIHYSAPFHFYSDTAYDLKPTLKLSYPIQHGLIHNWDKFERIISHIYYELLKVDPSANPAIVMDVPLCPFSQREKLATFFFETLRVPSLSMMSTAYGRILASGKHTGVIVECGEDVTTSVPIIEGIQYKYTIQQNYIAGRTVTEFLGKLIKHEGHWLDTSAEKELLRNIKEQACYIAIDYNKEYQMSRIEEAEQKLPDGQRLILSKNRFTAPEVLFRPNIFELEDKGLHKLIIRSIKKCKEEHKETLYQHILLSGGSMYFKNMTERVQKELDAICKTKAVVEKQEDIMTSAWKGGKIVADAALEEYMITSKEYEEKGSNSIKSKFQS